LEFLGAPGFKGGKQGVPLGTAAIQAEGNRLFQLNARSLSELVSIGSVLDGISSVWDRAGEKLEQIADETTIIRDLVELVRILIGLVKAGSQESVQVEQIELAPTATLVVPPTPWQRFLGWLRQTWHSTVAFVRESFLGLRYDIDPLSGELVVVGSALT